MDTKQKFHLHLLIVGARKCATTWLHRNLSANPELCFSSKVKESGFFSKYFDRGLNWYEALFDKSCEGLYAEVDTSLLRSAVAPENVYKYFPDIRIVLLIRKPRDLFRSSFLHAKRKGDLTVDASTAWREHREYYDELQFDVQVNRWFKYFSREQVLIIFYEQIKRSPLTVLEAIYKFSKVPYNVDIEILTEKVNVARAYRYKWFTRSMVIMARYARKIGVHSLVNFGKYLVPEKFLYKSGTDDFHLDEDIENELNNIENRQAEYFKNLQTIGNSDLWSNANYG